MEKPDLDRMWETWIKIGPANSLTLKIIQDTIRCKIGLTFPHLINEGKITWYHFLMHPYPKDPRNAYFHIRFSLSKDIQAGDLDLPDYCVPPQEITVGRNIAGINRALIKNEKIEEAWRIIGEQSQWIINLINIHKEGTGWIPIDQIVQFMHYYFNMLGLGFRGSISLPF